MAKGDMPVLVGVGQKVSHWDGSAGSVGAPSPLSLAHDASRAALADAGLSEADVIDTLAFVRIFEDSIPSAPHPHGHNTNLPGTLARDLGASPANLIYSTVGGNSPQALVNELAAAIHSGDIDCALITGSEAIGASKIARRAGLELDWADTSDLTVEDRGLGDKMLTRHEIKHGLIAAPYFYALFETAIAAREGRTRSAHRAAMSDLFATFSEVAATNPYSQFPTARSADWLATPSKDNYELADPFLKWHVAQDAVQQGAAALLMAESKADMLGIDQAKRIYLHGGGEASDDAVSARPRLDGSWAMGEALARALTQAGKSADDMAFFDIYSCFPCAVTSACAAMDIDPLTETRPLTLTGGLPFFGGPGNNYSLHGIASMAERLRAQAGAFGLILANGGWMSKEAAGIYSTLHPDQFRPAAPAAKPTERVEIAEAPTEGTLETYTVLHGRSGPERGIAACRNGEGKRFLALATPEAIAVLREDACQTGRPARVTTQGEVNTFTFA
ncbi:MAG: acetyl-CoA acetyltransferase [Hyphomonadaceae bacterium]|nr:acetyl-CoA acetyltransferase [Hyphomonadaceae bacterium]